VRFHFWPAIFSWCSFLGLAVLSIVYYQERVIFLDASYQFMLLYVEDELVVQNNRLGAVIPQILPLWALRAGNLRLGMLLYSLSFVLLPFVGWIALHYGLREKRFSLTLPLSAILMTLHTFFWMQSELLIAIDLTLIGGSLVYWVDNKRRSAWLFPAAIIMSLAVVTHPLALIAVVFTLSCIAISSAVNWQKRVTVLSGVALMGLWIEKEFFFPKALYDQQNVALLSGFWENPGAFWGYRSHRLFLEYICTDYLVWTLVLIGTTLFLRKQKAWWLMLLLYGSVLGYTSLINATYTWRIDQFHIESFYRMLAMMVAIVLAVSILPKITYQRRLIWLVLIGCMLRLGHILIIGSTYRERIEVVANLIHYARTQPGQALVLPENILKDGSLGMTWAMPFETALLSRLQEPDSAMETILVLPEARFKEFSTPSGTFLGPFGSLNLLPQNRFFPFTDSMRYAKIEEIPADIFGESLK